MDTPILIELHWKFEFHVHKDASNFVVEAMLVHNLTEKCNKQIIEISIPSNIC